MEGMLEPYLYTFLTSSPGGVNGQRYCLALLHPEKDVVPILQFVRCFLESVWKGAENLTRPGVQTPISPARSELLYRLRYPSYQTSMIV